MSAARLAWGRALAICAVVLAVAALVVHGIRGATFEARLRASADEQLGGELHYSSLAFSLLPTQIELTDVELSFSPTSGPVFRSPTTIVDVALLPLLMGRLEVDSLSASAPVLEGMRGLESQWPHFALSGEVLRVDSRTELVVRDAELRVGALRVRGSLRIEARGSGLYFFAYELDRGGRLLGEVRFDAETVSGFDLELHSVAAAPLLPAIPDLQQLSGLLDGRLELLQEEGGGRCEARLELRESILRVEDVRFAGTLGLEADLNVRAGGSRDSAVLGDFRLDAAQAEIDYEGGFRKALGQPARLSGDLRLQPGGRLSLSDLRWKIQGFEIFRARRSSP